MKDREKFMDEVTERVFDRWFEWHFHRLNEAERNFFCVAVLDAEVCNGGFDQYYFNSPADVVREVIDALRAIGATETAEIVIAANGLFKDGCPPLDDAERQDLLSAMDDEARMKFEPLNERFFTISDDLDNQLYGYALKHKKELGV
jgi:hypothetical protein